jgi:ABC-type transport system involved in multi-copper enzyme maturation permease subunit
MNAPSPWTVAFHKIWAIAWKELYITFSDRNLLLIMLATPLAISTIVGLAFGGMGGGDVPVRDIPIAILNQDQGASGFNFGQVYLDLLAPGQASSGGASDLPDCDLPGVENGSTNPDQPGAGVTLAELTEAVAFDRDLADELISAGRIPLPAKGQTGAAIVEAAARGAVDRGIYTAAVFIPPGFSQRLIQIGATGGGDPLQVEVYGNGGQPISAGIVHSIVDGITNQLLTGSITIAAAFSVAPPPAEAAGSIDFAAVFACAFTPEINTIRLEPRSVEGQEAESIASLILVSIGSAQAMFFALFTAQFGVFSMYDERRQWTLQRLLTSPTPKSYILAGKLVGVFMTVLFQLLLLMVALSLVGSLLEGRPRLIWGTDLALIALVLGAVALAVAGFGMLLAGVASSPEQGQLFGSLLNMAMAVLGGSFGFTLPPAIAAVSLIYWGRQAFEKLATGQGDVRLNLLVLAILGVVMYLLGLFLFNRKFKL